jgi:hypothetical protein
MCTCNEEPGKTPSGGQGSTGTSVASDAVFHPIRAVIQPGFEHAVSIRIVPGRDMFAAPIAEGCQPRGDRPPRPWPWPFSEDLVAQLTDANTKLVAWLSSTDDNSKQFLDDPVTALASAGVELSRADMKSIARSHAAVREDAVLPPGAKLTALKVTASRRGKVGDVDTSKAGGRTHVGPIDPPAVKPNRRTCGC